MGWYDYPAYYDIAFQSETGPEADFIQWACQTYASGTVRRLLEPACGTGRLLVELARRGYQVFGLDSNPAALKYLQRRLRQRGLRSLVFRADMSRFRLARPVDAAYCTFDSFRHLLTEEAARRHLECMSEAVRTGGIYILGLHLLPPDAAPECIERWTERRGRLQVTVTLRVLRCNRRRRWEWIRISLLVRKYPLRKPQPPQPKRLPKQFHKHPPARTQKGLAWENNSFRNQKQDPLQPGGVQLLRVQDEFPLRIYTARQFRHLLARVPQWELADVYDFWYEIDHPLKLTDQMADAVFILRRR